MVRIIFVSKCLLDYLFILIWRWLRSLVSILLLVLFSHWVPLSSIENRPLIKECLSTRAAKRSHCRLYMRITYLNRIAFSPMCRCLIKISSLQSSIMAKLTKPPLKPFPKTKKTQLFVSKMSRIWAVKEFGKQSANVFLMKKSMTTQGRTWSYNYATINTSLERINRLVITPETCYLLFRKPAQLSPWGTLINV